MKNKVSWRNVLPILLQKRQVTVCKDKLNTFKSASAVPVEDCFSRLAKKWNNCFTVKHVGKGERNQLSLLFLQNLPSSSQLSIIKEIEPHHSKVWSADWSPLASPTSPPLASTSPPAQSYWMKNLPLNKVQVIHTLINAWEALESRGWKYMKGCKRKGLGLVMLV